MIVTLNIINAVSAEIISGFVVDGDTGNRLSQVNLLIIDSEIGTTTNIDGQFNLNGSFKYPLKLEISHIGYKTHIELIDKSINGKIQIQLYRQSIQMEELVVTATRTKKLHSDVPIATEVIDRKDIENSGARNIADLLSQRSGVSLQTSVEGGSVLNILGMDSRYILILIDGQPITGRFNNRASLDQIITDRVKKIEIVKGPSSSLYGSEAMGGVINIITYDDKYSQSINLSARYSDTQNKICNNGIGNGSKNISVNVVQPLKNTIIGINFNQNAIVSDQSIELIEIDQIDKKSIGGSIIWNLSEHQSVNFNMQSYDQTEKGESKLMNTHTDIKRNNFSLSHKVWNFEQTITSNNYSRNYVQKRPLGKIEKDDLTSEKFLEYEVLYNKKIGTNVISTGLEIYRANYQSDRIRSGKQDIINRSLFGQYDIDIIDKINAIIGVRLDDYSDYESVLSPRIGLMYRYKENWKFRTAWSQGFRAPSFMERFIDWNHIQFNYTVIGNPNLHPERSNGMTLGVEYTNSNKYQMSLMFYHTQFENLINDFTLKPGLLSYQNIEKAIFSGVELISQWRISKQWNSRFGINWINNRDGDNKIIPNTMPLSINGNVHYQNPGDVINVSINTKWVAPYRPHEYDAQKGVFVFAEQKLKGYALITIRSSLKIYNSLQLSLGVENAGNYTNSRFGPFIGRAAYLELSTQLNQGE